MGSKKQRNQKVDKRVFIPVYIPTEGGVGDIELGVGEVRGETLIINFNDLIPAQAIKGRFERGELTGITFTVPDEEAEAAKIQEDEIQRRQDEAREHQELLENETPEERQAREDEEERQAAVDAALLEAELERLEE